MITFPTLDFSHNRILIVGDVMLDQSWHGDTARISPEAPVPIVNISRIDEFPGGAGNVAMNIASLGAQARLLGIIGTDLAADVVERLLSSQGVECLLSRIIPYPTITKMRVLSRNQQLLRMDVEQQFHGLEDCPLTEHFEPALTGVQVAILSDYGKGTLKEPLAFIAKARQMAVPVLVDPKRYDYAAYAGATLVTPNFKEFEATVGACPSLEILEEKARSLLTKYNIEYLLVTRGDQGMSLIHKDAEATHIPALAREVFDVTGAGDTVIATLAMCMAAGFDVVQAATIANIAAGLVVAKVGTATLGLHELQSAISSREYTPAISSRMDEEAILHAITAAKAAGERIVFTNGCFDILHAGHVMYLEQAKRLGDRLVVGLNDDASIKRLKGSSRPVNHLEDRLAVLAGLKSVDWVLPFSEDTPERIIQKISPHWLVKGGDYKDVQAIPGVKWVLSHGGQVKLLGLKEGCSTTNIINSITAIAEADSA